MNFFVKRLNTTWWEHLLCVCVSAALIRWVDNSKLSILCSSRLIIICVWYFKYFFMIVHIGGLFQPCYKTQTPCLQKNLFRKKKRLCIQCSAYPHITLFNFRLRVWLRMCSVLILHNIIFLCTFFWKVECSDLYV